MLRRLEDIHNRSKRRHFNEVALLLLVIWHEPVNDSLDEECLTRCRVCKIVMVSPSDLLPLSMPVYDTLMRGKGS